MDTRVRFDASLYLVTDERIAGSRPMTEVVRQAIAGGVTLVQVREKGSSIREFIERVRAIRSVARVTAVPVLVNDRLDVALAAEADGLHVGSDDMPVSIARRLLGAERILGVTVEDPDSARRAAAEGADYVACSSVFSTSTKLDTGPPVGVQGLARIVDAVRIPVVAIGGIHAENAAGVLATGVSGIAVVSAIVDSADCKAAAAELRTILDLQRLAPRVPDCG